MNKIAQIWVWKISNHLQKPSQKGEFGQGTEYKISVQKLIVFPFTINTCRVTKIEFIVLVTSTQNGISTCISNSTYTGACAENL